MLEEYKKQTLKWDLRFLKLAEEISSWSKDPSTRVGAVIVDGINIVSVGYNGFPKNVDDDPKRYNDRQLKYKLIVHGEINAILQSNRKLEGCTIYTTPFPPCSRCAGAIIQAEITRVVSWVWDREEYARWVDDFNIGMMMFKESSVRYKEINKNMR